MYAIIIGAGRTGVGVARALAGRGAQVTLVEIRPEAAERARRALPGATVVVADGATVTGLLQAAPAGADVLVAVTDSDEANLLAAALARGEFAVPRVIARAVDPAQAWLYTGALGVDIALSDAEWLAQIVMEDVTPEALARLVRLRQSGLTLHECEVGPGSTAAGRPLSELTFPAGGTPVAIYRAGQTLSPSAGTAVEPGDVFVVVARHDQGPAITAALNPPEPVRPPIEVLGETSEPDQEPAVTAAPISPEPAGPPIEVLGETSESDQGTA